MKRPRCNTTGSYVTTPKAVSILQFFGAGMRAGAVSMSPHEFRNVQRLYGYTPEPPSPKPPPPEPPVETDFPTAYAYEKAVRRYEEDLRRHANWTDPRPFLQAGADRNTVRHAEVDGRPRPTRTFKSPPHNPLCPSSP